MSKQKTIIKEDLDSVTIQRGNKKYVVYFDKPDFCVYCEDAETGSLVTVEIPDSPIGSLKTEFHPNW